MTSSCHVSAGPLHPTNLLNQNEVNIMQWYSQMSGTNKPEWASVLLFWSMYTFSWIAIKQFWLWQAQYEAKFDFKLDLKKKIQ